jgi:hypothetical protein
MKHALRKHSFYEIKSEAFVENLDREGHFCNQRPVSRSGM